MDGWTASPCKCLEMRKYKARLNRAMIPLEFESATLENFKCKQEVHKKLLNAANQYLEKFDAIKDTGNSSMGFIAERGESRINALKDPRQKEAAKLRYNSYGLGKTHLQIGIAKKLLDRGESVVVVSDAVIMDELMLLKKGDDSSEYQKKLSTLIHVPVLVWDDLAKTNSSEAKRAVYYQIINERWKLKNAIIFSSNEDIFTLEDRLGGAAMSRLNSMAYGRIVQCSGTDMRLQMGVAQ